MRRMDRYNDESVVKETRSLKNQELYQDINTNPKYTNITDVTNSNAYEISTQDDSKTTRETYQQMKKYQDVQEVPKVKKELDDFNYLYKGKERKIYDINSVLEDARKNRKDEDELDEKRKLKYTSYNILAGVNLEELEKYREEKKKREMTPEEANIHEFIDTIASKTLAGEIDKDTTVDLLSDLMATSILDTVAPQLPSEEQREAILQSNIQEEQDDNNDEKLEAPVSNEEVKPDSDVDNEFYSKSMDLSENDLDMSDEFQDKGLPLGVKILIVIVILILLVVAGYFIYLRIK